jgi:hypothetical protein
MRRSEQHDEASLGSTNFPWRLAKVGMPNGANAALTRSEQHVFASSRMGWRAAAAHRRLNSVFSHGLDPKRSD